MKLALAPIDVRIGSPQNLEIHQTAIIKAAKQGADLVVFPELSLVGYPSQDFLLRPDYVERAEVMLLALHKWLQEEYPQVAVIVGSVLRVDARTVSPRGLANGAVFLQGDRCEYRAKTLIPSYDVFHESRYFDSALDLPDSFRAPIEFQEKKLGILICEDSWHDTRIQGRRLYLVNPTEHLVKSGCDFLINISASPFDRKKKALRRATIEAAAKLFSIPIAYVNHFGAQDELLFDGDAFVAHPEASGKEDVSASIVFWAEGQPHKAMRRLAQAELRDLKAMLVTGIRDYAAKNSLGRVVLGLSGGIDSAVVAVLASEALGPENVIGLAMPSKYSSAHSVEDAELLAKNLGIRFRHFPIKMPHSTFALALKPFFEGLPEDVTEENLQSRLRGMAVMAFANKFRAMALATGNKSEFAVGYATLYGDMCGALAPIGDLYKTEVYELAHFLNGERASIPERTLTKAPSAELKPHQTDQDTLPPYENLDQILRLFVEEELSPERVKTLLESKVTANEVDWVAKALQGSEFKRFQAPPILRVSTKSFGRGRLYPLTGSSW